jgi:putative glutamine amidotransferase
MKIKYLAVLFGLFILYCLTGCGGKAEEIPVNIALSKGSPAESYANYYDWVNSLDSSANCLDMYDMPMNSALILLKSCSGLILTGGTDINPALYDQPGDTLKCTTTDDYLDQLELRLIDSAMAWGMPMLGICRGHQMMNVAFGGSLIIDIPTMFDTTVSHRCENYMTCFHPVEIENGSMLSNITGLQNGTVNSNHHQGIKELSPELKIVAYSPDGLPESVEWADPVNKPFLLGVQWHPERLGNENPLSGKVGQKFLEECRKYKRN